MKTLNMTRRNARTALVLLIALISVAGVAAAADGVVNVNTADEETLQLLPRIGPAVASRIIEHREANGPFKSKEELLLVRGIGESTFERLEPYVVVDGSTTLTEKVRSRATEER